jgi:hypothetical protein
MDKFYDELNALMAQYRDLLPDFDPSAEFMPKLWQRIEARRSFTLRMKRLTQVFVATAAALCLLMTGALVLPSSTPGLEPHGTYVDVLAEAHPTESLAAIGIVPEIGELNKK